MKQNGDNFQFYLTVYQIVAGIRKGTLLESRKPEGGRERERNIGSMFFLVEIL